jgi:hypothetical protein
MIVLQSLVGNFQLEELELSLGWGERTREPFPSLPSTHHSAHSNNEGELFFSGRQPALILSSDFWIQVEFCLLPEVSKAYSRLLKANQAIKKIVNFFLCVSAPPRFKSIVQLQRFVSHKPVQGCARLFKPIQPPPPPGVWQNPFLQNEPNL